MLTKLTSLFMTVIMFIFPYLNIPEAKVDKSEMKTNYTCVFVHGLCGWGGYNLTNNVAPYWGMFGGDLTKYLNARGFDTYAATVNQNSSAWDRACELYAQLTGTRVDYGKEHSQRCGHARYGRDFSCMPLIKKFDSENKINLIGHSFGGTTALMFIDLMADGSEKERAVTPKDELSPLFEGGKGDYIYSLTTLASPMNGTTAIEVKTEVENDPNATLSEKAVVGLMSVIAYTKHDGRDKKDTAGYDLSIDACTEMMKEIETRNDIYYFSVPTCATETVNGVTTPKAELIEAVYAPAAYRMAAYTGATEGGVVLDESWQPNDGLVNVKSSIAPFNAPQQALDKNNIQPGIWNILPTETGDHMSLMGGMTINKNIRPLITDLLLTINKLG